MKGIFILGLCISPAVFFAQLHQDSIKETQIQEVTLLKRLPVAKEIINVERDLSQKNLGQDLPVLLKNQTSVLSTSDAGNGIGYTGFRIRGVNGRSVNVMMNGVPYNDSESQGTFFVNVPDLTSSASQILIQRGVGTSSNGVSAFGASVNIISKNPEEKFYLKSDNSYGSFNTYKYSAEIGSGKFWNNRLSLMGRYTKIHSDGFIERAFSDLESYNFTALFEENTTKIRLMAFGGKEKTYQAWNGIDKKTWETNPKFNISGAIYNSDWSEIIDFYGNETDNYRQNHYQLLWDQKLGSKWDLETTLHYTKGKGYYDNYKQSAKFSKYNLPNQGSESRTDFIRKKWLDNDFYGIVSTLYGKFDKLNLNFGLVANQYFGEHFGNVSGVSIPEINEHEYYRNRSVKNEISGFAKSVYQINDLELFLDLQMRNISYDTKILLDGDGEGVNMEKKWLFFNPKAGISYRIPSGKIFVSYANAHREPNRDDLFANPQTKAESLHDIELGLEKSFGKLQLSANAYYMYFVNQLVFSGVINDVGDFLRQNVDKSYRTGVELAAVARLNDNITLNGNLTISKNKIREINSQDENNQLIVLKDVDISLSPNVLGNLGIQYDITKNLNFGITGQYAGKQYLNNTQNEELCINNYFIADFNTKYRLELKNTAIDFKLLVNNVFNKKYVNNGYVYNGPVYFAQAGTNFMFGVSFLIK